MIVRGHLLLRTCALSLHRTYIACGWRKTQRNAVLDATERAFGTRVNTFSVITSMKRPHSRYSPAIGIQNSRRGGGGCILKYRDKKSRSPEAASDCSDRFYNL